MTQALEAKEKGNAAFRAGKWDESIGHYSVAIVADRSNPTFPLNRAAASLRLGKNEDAERDCTTVLRINSTSTKALYRRAQARIAIGKFSEAQDDLIEALILDPCNITLKSDLERSLRRQPIVESPRVVSTSKVIHRRERIPIIIIDGSSSPSGLSQHILSPPPAQQYLKPSSRTSPPAVGSSGTRHNVAVDTSTSSSCSLLPPKFKPPPMDSVLGELTETRSRETEAVQTPTRRAPSTLFEFTQEWNSSASTAEKWQIIQSIPLSAIKSLFGKSLTPPLLLTIVDSIQCVLYDASGNPSSPHNTSSNARAFITALPNVDRFPTLITLLTHTDKAKVAKLLQSVGVARSAWGF